MSNTPQPQGLKQHTLQENLFGEVELDGRPFSNADRALAAQKIEDEAEVINGINFLRNVMKSPVCYIYDDAFKKYQYAKTFLPDVDKIAAKCLLHGELTNEDLQFIAIQQETYGKKISINMHREEKAKFFNYAAITLEFIVRYRLK